MEPTNSEWMELYQAANAFYALKCWEWMWDINIFGVEDPDSGETVYCSIMGNSGQHFALGAYMGSHGLAGLEELFAAPNGEDDPDLLFAQNGLMCSFENRTELNKRDLDVIKSLELKYRGRKAWPQFRFYETGFVPWYITAEQCRLLTHVLQQAIDVATRCQKNKKLIELRNQDRFLVRSCAKQADGTLIWRDTYKAAEPYKPLHPSYEMQDEVALKRFKALPKDRRLVLEVDFFYIPTPVQDQGRPYYPMLCAFVDHKSGVILAIETIADGNNDRHLFIDRLFQLILENGRKPSKLMVAREATYRLFATTAEQIGVPMQIVIQVDKILEFRDELTMSFMG